MSNRFTRTSLTNRQKESILSARIKILKIIADRFEIARRSNNENEYVILKLEAAIDNIDEALEAAMVWVDEQ